MRTTMDDDAALSEESVGLTVCGLLYSRDPPGSFAIDPDNHPVQLAEILEAALGACGLGDRLQEVHDACRAAAMPHFAKRVAELEKVRRDIVAKETESSGREVT
jgi:hypothetical protein